VLRALGNRQPAGGNRVGPTKFPDVPWPEALVVPPPWEGGDGRAINQKKRTSTTATERAAPRPTPHAP